MNFYWIILILAGFSEIGWTVFLKISEEFSKPIPTLLSIGFLVLSVILLALAIKKIPIGIAYAIWTSIGIIGVSVAGMFFFSESQSLIKLIFITLIVIGVVGLQLITE